MNEYILAATLGAIGGMARATLGLLKAIALKRTILWKYWFITVITALAIGSMTGVVFSFSIPLSVLAGYAGTDMLEGLYKAFLKQKITLTFGK